MCIYVCMYVCMYVSTYASIYLSISINLDLSIYLYIYTYIYLVVLARAFVALGRPAQPLVAGLVEKGVGHQDECLHAHQHLWKERSASFSYIYTVYAWLPFQHTENNSNRIFIYIYSKYIEESACTLISTCEKRNRC